MDRRIELTPRFLWGTATVVLLAIGSLGPWVTLGPFSASGTGDGNDGAITLVLAILAAVLVCLRRWRIVTALLAVGALVVGIIDTNNVSSARNELLEPSVGWGLVAVDIAAVSLIVWALVALCASRSDPKAVPLAPEGAEMSSPNA
jgi:lysylphosphatidylglycerol synthetase-like protein (DUF2156 family)